MNPFSLNLAFLKKRAKTLLKSITSGSEDNLNWLLKLHPSNSITPETVKLSDIHLALSRELGVSSWTKLTSHIQKLEENKSKDGVPLGPLDNELETLHVRCGHDIQHTLKNAGFTGDFLAFIDPYCTGPLKHKEEELEEVRAQFILDTLLSEMGNSESSLEALKLEASLTKQTLCNAKYDRVVLWVEHDNYDQLMLIRVLCLLSYQNTSKVELIEVNQFPGRTKFIGLGQLPPEAIRSLWGNRRTITTQHIIAAKQAWKAFCSNTPLQLVKQYQEADEALLPNLKPVILRHLQELPNQLSGLGMTQKNALDILRESDRPLNFRELYNEYLNTDPLPYLGDVMFWAIIKPLTLGKNPRIGITSSSDHSWQNFTFALNTKRLEITQEVEPKWVAGIEITKEHYWCWDHQNFASLSLRLA
ncbi:DUF1835 domain-containing protein [Vibrio profundi]|uniref:DUF1835 domain-containing protein n=1 Tax=Vibrio profundi TaxID=1774960 RepID=UPI0037367C2F